MVQPAQRSRLQNLLLALMPYTGPGKFKLAEAETLLPDWLLLDYAGHCDPALKHQLEGPAGYLTAAAESAAESPLPLLCERRGEAMALVTGGESPRKAQALITLPVWRQTTLKPWRNSVACARCWRCWLDVEPAALESLYRSAVGEITAQLISTGFGSVLRMRRMRRPGNSSAAPSSWM